ncbi:MAG TPA: IclR family transcriptional regulator C-terminal domain-containing protein [Xanthobacteraceae bacterium]|nr:IclR family transcriptional regulator C-terminal domain-containing protein [Xanthobacteraceae bacterium]
MVAGLEKGLAIIEAFDQSRPRLSLSEAAAVTGLTRAAARRYLLTLTRLGYAEFDGKFFSLTPRILRLGYAYASSAKLPARVQPALEQISAATGESSSAAILEDRSIVYIARSATRRIMSISLTVGTHLPAYCTSMGRVLLAWSDAATLSAYLADAPFEKLTAKTRTTEAELREELALVRRDGYALIDEELELGLRSIAVPVFDSRERLVCAVNIGVQAARMSIADMPARMLPALQAAQAELRRIV